MPACALAERARLGRAPDTITPEGRGRAACPGAVAARLDAGAEGPYGATILFWSRLQFAFTITYHYLFPQLTMGLALLLVVMKVLALKTNRAHWDELARFWGRIFALNFAVGVVTGIPMEFQFGTNWARFSERTGGVVGLTLAMEGLFAFFAESAFLGLFLYGEKKLGPRGHLFATFMVFVGSWLSGYFIIVTNSFMQHPVGYVVQADGRFALAELGPYLLQPVGVLGVRSHDDGGRHHRSVRRVGRVRILAPDRPLRGPGAGRAAPRGHCRARGVRAPDCSHRRPARQASSPGTSPSPLAAMEGKFESGTHAEIDLVGQPNVAENAAREPDRRFPGS